MLKNSGFCVTCDMMTIFEAKNNWLRDSYICTKCNSIPRERALMYFLQIRYPNYKNLKIMESSPANRGASLKLSKLCSDYIGTHYFPNNKFGLIINGYRNENLENMTFPDNHFDIIVTQDVMEHLFDPKKAFNEIMRVLKKGGSHIFTTPLVNKDKPSEIKASLNQDGEIIYFGKPEYHGNPIDNKGSLVTYHWGFDIVDKIKQWTGYESEIVFIQDTFYGIKAEYNEVIITKKL